MQATTSDLLQQVGSAISQSPYLPAQRVSFQAHDDQVILEGVVNSFFQKQMAQEAVMRIDGIRHIENRLRVVRN